MNFETFKEQLRQEILSNHDKRTPNKNKLLLATNLAGLFTILSEIDHPEHIKIVADSPAFHELILANLDDFVTYFSRENIKAIIHQVSIKGNLPLVTRLIDEIKMDVTKELVASPHNSYYKNNDGNYRFMNSVPVLHAGAKSLSMDMANYLLSFYDQSYFDSKQVDGIVQEALCIAAKHKFSALVHELIARGINVNSHLKEFHSPTPALYYAVLSGDKSSVEALVENKASISELNKDHAVSCGHVDIVKYFVSKGITFTTTGYDSQLLKSFESGNVEMPRYFIDTLKASIYPKGELSADSKKNHDTKILKKVLSSGSIEMLQYIETELNIPVTDLIREEMAKTKNYHHMYGEFLLIESFHAYNVKLSKYLFETKQLMPSQAQLYRLEGYAYDNGRCLPQHQKFVTHAYVYSLIHQDVEMREILNKASDSNDLSSLTNSDLFKLFADYTKHFPERRERAQYKMFFRANSLHLADELAKRKLSPAALVELARQDNGRLAKDIQFYLIVSGQGYSDEEVKEILTADVFDCNADLSNGDRPLHLAIYYYTRMFLIPTLLSLGANPDIKNNNGTTPINLTDSDGDECEAMLKQAGSLENTMMSAIRSADLDLTKAILHHLNGNVEHSQILNLLVTGLKQPLTVYTILCNLSEPAYAAASLQVKRYHELQLIELLSHADHFRQMKTHPPAIEEYQRLEKLKSLKGVRGGCCGGGLDLFDYFSISASVRKQPYPAFLQNHKINPTQLTPEKVAHALWMSDKSHYGTESSKVAFSIWADKKKLKFGLEQVEKCLEARYTMK